MSAPVPRRPGGALRRLARLLAWPVRRYFGTQFDWTRAQVVETDHRLQGRLDGQREEQREALETLRGELAKLRHDVAELRGAVAMSALSATEALAGVGHELRLLGEGAAPGPAANGAPPARATATAVVVAHAARALAGLPAGTRVLVTGADTGSLALALAALGHRVTALGARPGGPPHPGLTTVTEGLERWRPPGEPFDAAVALVAPAPGAGIEGRDPGGAWARAEALERVHALLRPGAPLVVAWPAVGDEDPPGLAPERWEARDEGVPASSGPSGWALRILRARAAGGPAPE